jgi:hypothetical protein
MPSLSTSGKMPALIGAILGWSVKSSGDGRDGSTVYASHKRTRSPRVRPAAGSMTCGMYRTFFTWSKYSIFVLEWFWCWVRS